MYSVKSLCLSLGLILISSMSLGQPAKAQEAVTGTVDFAIASPQKSMSGFLNGISAQQPPNSMITPLKPAWWRISGGDTTAYKRVSSLGARVQLVVSDAYGYPLNNWNGKGAPWENNWQAWDNEVRQLALQYKGKNVYWDIWNEPDDRDWNKKVFWSGTQAQFFEAYRRAYQILRDELGTSAMIGGPSYANYEPTDIKAFLNYCRSKGIQVNFLSWHELGGADLNIPSVATHIRYVRNLASQFSTLKMQKILINESVGPQTQYFPGDILGYLYYMEKGGADGSNKACWDDSQGQNNCYNNSLDGIVIPKTSAPRAAWWAYKTYSDGIATRVKTTTRNPNIVLLASRTPRQVLLGYFGQNMPQTTSATVRLKNLSAIGLNGSRLLVTLYRIPASGEAALQQPIKETILHLPVKQNAVTLKVPKISLHDAYLITLAPES